MGRVATVVVGRWERLPEEEKGVEKPRTPVEYLAPVLLARPVYIMLRNLDGVREEPRAPCALALRERRARCRPRARG